MAHRAKALRAIITSARPARCIRLAPSITFIDPSAASLDPDRTSEANLALWIPSDLYVCGRHRLLSRQVDRRLVVLEIKAAIHFDVGPDALHHLEPDVVQRGSVLDGWRARAGRRRRDSLCDDKVLRRLLVARVHLDPLVAAQVIRHPRLAALVFAANPVSEELSVVGVTLLLGALKVHETPAVAGGNRRIRPSHFHTRVKLGRAGNVREVQARPPRSAPRSIDRRYVVVHLAIRVEREPVAHERQTIRKVECAKSRAGIVPAELDVWLRRRNAEEAFQEGMQSDRNVSLASPDNRALKAKLEIISGAKADLFHVHPGSSRVDGIDRIGICGIGRVGYEIVTMQAAYQKLVTEGARNARKQRDAKRLHPINLKSVDVLGVVEVCKRCALSRPEPLVLLAERDLVIQDMR